MVSNNRFKLARARNTLKPLHWIERNLYYVSVDWCVNIIRKSQFIDECPDITEFHESPIKKISLNWHMVAWDNQEKIFLFMIDVWLQSLYVYWDEYCFCFNKMEQFQSVKISCHIKRNIWNRVHFDCNISKKRTSSRKFTNIGEE